jgi:membrane protein
VGSKGIGSLLSVPNPKGRIDRLPVVGFVWRLYRGYSRRNGPLLSAGIAYYALFSMGPLLILTLQITGYLFGDGPASPEVRLTEVLSEYVGADMAAMLASAMTQLTSSSTDSTAWTIVSLGILLYGATRLFVRLQASFNMMWDVRIISRGFSFRRLMSRLLVFGLILIPTVLLVVGLVLGTAARWLEHLVDGSGLVVSIAQAAIPFVISWLALVIIFVVLPDIHLRIRDCWFTSLLVAIAWAVGTRIFSTYLSWSGNQKYAGAIGALIGLIFWVDIMAIITLVGVRFNRAIYLWRGKTIDFHDYAAPITELPDVEGTTVESAAATASSGAHTSSPADTSPSTASADERASEAAGGHQSKTPHGAA